MVNTDTYGSKFGCCNKSHECVWVGLPFSNNLKCFKLCFVLSLFSTIQEWGKILPLTVGNMYARPEGGVNVMCDILLQQNLKL